MNSRLRDLHNLKQLLKKNKVVVHGDVGDADEELALVFCTLPNETQVQCAKFASQFLVEHWDTLNLDPTFYRLIRFNGGTVFVTPKSQDVYDRDSFEISMLVQVASQLSHLHSLGLAHCDVKLENIVQDAENKYRLIDFDFMSFVPVATSPIEFVQSQSSSSMYGTRGHRNADATAGLVSYRADLCAFLAMFVQSYKPPRALQNDLWLVYYSLAPWDQVNWALVIEKIQGWVRSPRRSRR